MTARKAWKVYYRKVRVVRRETLKATIDTVLYGTGVVLIPSDGGDPKHIPIAEFKFEEYID